MTKVLSLLYMMAIETDVEMNTRAMNTILRGCLRVGEIPMAWRIFQAVSGKSKNHNEIEDSACPSEFSDRRIYDLFVGVELDTSSYEYIVALLAQGMKIPQALEVMEHMANTASSLSSSSLSSLSSQVSAGGRGVDINSNPVSHVHIYVCTYMNVCIL